MATDEFERLSDAVTADLRAATRWGTVTFDQDFETFPRGIYCNAAGYVALRDRHGNTKVFTVTEGAILPCAPLRVVASGTTVAADTLIPFW